MPSGEIQKYLDLIDENARFKVLPIIEYIERHYGRAVFDGEYSEKTGIPTYRLGEKFVGIGCRKRYISLYFSGETPVKVTASLTGRVKCGKRCLSVSYNGITDYEALFRGIDSEFENPGNTK